METYLIVLAVALAVGLICDIFMPSPPPPGPHALA